MVQFLKQRWVYHTLIWLSLISLLVIIEIFEDDSFTSAQIVFSPIMRILPIIMTVYLSFIARERLFDLRKYKWFALSIILIIMVITGLFEILSWSKWGLNNSISQSITNVVFIMLLSLGLQYFKRGIIGQYQIQELRAKSAEIELNALKAQINPHFLFNTLNNIYGINQIDSEIGSEMLLELSDVMRYHLSFSKRERVSLKDEIELIKSYISLEKLRLQDNCEVSFIYPKEKTNAIAPLLFLPFIENAFKHGTHPLSPCFVHIEIKLNKDTLLFKIENSMIQNKQVVKTNIGLENTKKRLNLIYADSHLLKIEENDNKFSVNLKIEL